MCITLNKIKNKSLWGEPKPLIAEEDIVVYKLLYTDRTSVIYRFQYEVGEAAKHINLKPERIYGLSLKYKVNQGYHCLLSKSKNLGWLYDYAYKAIIPKGSQYFYGDNNDIVSSSLIVTDEIAWGFRD